MFEIINNTDKEIEEINKLEEYMKFVIEKLEVSRGVFNIIFVSNDEIHSINREFRNTDRVTDVISFALEDNEEEVFTTWLMMPQSVEGKTVTVTYIINSRQFTSVFALDKNLTEKKWAVNQHIKYIVTLTPNVISFTPTVEDWKAADEIKHGN